MLPDKRFKGLHKEFWANVRAISEQRGYTVRGTGRIKVHSIQDAMAAMRNLHLGIGHLYDSVRNEPTELGATLVDYFEYRAEALNNYVEPRLMDAARAKAVFDELKAKLNPTVPIPMNKQKGNMAAPNYMTGLVNMLIEANCEGLPCDYSPMGLTTFTKGGAPLRTLARRIDGCFPDRVNSVAVWEIKEYYYATTFGSRVADGVYETLLDGLELEELRENEGIKVEHCLIIDGHYTWWESGGRSYLCRLMDTMHMGYVDEILFGYEVVERLPSIVKGWVEIVNQSRGIHIINKQLPLLEGTH